VVGDDAQSIYSFRAATVENILGFPGQYAPAAAVVTLEENYRSTQAVLDAANALIAEGKRQYRKTLTARRGPGERPRYVTVADDRGQADYVVAKVLDARERGVLLRRQAVLFRSSHHSDGLELELVRRNIPYVKYGGLKFLEAAHVKDLLAVLRWADNPKNRVAAFRALQLQQGIGPGTAARIFERFEAGAFSWNALGTHSPDFDALMRAYGPGAPGLFYTYRNEPKGLNIVSDSFLAVVDKLNREIDKRGDPLTSIIKGEDQLWDVSLLKFIYEITRGSLQTNLSQLGARGLLSTDSSGVPVDARLRIEELFNMVAVGGCAPGEHMHAPPQMPGSEQDLPSWNTSPLNSLLQVLSSSANVHREPVQHAPPHEKVGSPHSLSKKARPPHCTHASTDSATAHFSFTQHETPHSSSSLVHSVANGPGTPPSWSLQ